MKKILAPILLIITSCFIAYVINQNNIMAEKLAKLEFKLPDPPKHYYIKIEENEFVEFMKNTGFQRVAKSYDSIGDYSVIYFQGSYGKSLTVMTVKVRND